MIIIWEMAGVTTRQNDSWAYNIKATLENVGVEAEIINPLHADVFSKKSTGHIISGGEVSVATTPESRQILELAVSLIKMDIPVLGICLGAHILAAAIAGKVVSGPAKNGLEVGIVDIHNSKNQLQNVSTFHSHEVYPEFLERENVELLASNDHCKVQAFRYNLVTATQFHPELNRRSLAEAVRANPTWVENYEARAGQIETGSQPTANVVEDWLLKPLRINS